MAEQLGLDPRAFDAEWSARRAGRAIGALPDYRDALRDICHTMHHIPDETVIERLYEERLAFFAGAFTRTSNDVLAVLKHLGSQGVHIGVISNSVPESVAAWPQSPIQRLVHDVVFSHQVGRAKPQPDIYLLACQRIGVAPERSIFVGDGENDELAGAEQVGMRSYWATWFLDQWPTGTRAEFFYERAARYPRLRVPADLIRAVDLGSSSKA